MTIHGILERSFVLTKKVDLFSGYRVTELREFLLTFGSAVALSLAMIFISVFLNTQFKFEAPYLLLFAVILSARLGNLNSGLLAVLITAIGYIYFFIPDALRESSTNTNAIFSLIVFTSLGFLISFIIDAAQKSNQVEALRRKQLSYMHLLSLEQAKNLKAREEIKSRDEFMSIASHEFKTPLSVSLLQIQTALHNIRNVSLANFSVEDLMKMLESVEHQTNRLSKMIQDLSSMSLITTGRLKLEPEETDLGQITQEVISRLPSTFGQNNYQINLDIQKPVIGKWDKLRLEQVVINLISNAIKYGDHKPVGIKIELSGQLARLTIQDHGIGIPKESQKRIFNRFERAATSKDYQGLGIGLYISNLIVVAHGGKITVNSKNGNGSTFTVELPLTTR